MTDPAALAIGLAERGLLPDPVIRAGIRRLLHDTLARERAGGAAGIRARRAARLAAMRTAPIAPDPEAARRQHYEWPTAYFEQVLGPRLKYSSGYWPAGVRTLAEAEEAMLAETGAHAALADGQSVLELGCGWGSLTLWMAERHPGSRFTAVSHSRTQCEAVRARAAARGLANVQVLHADVNTLAPAERYDRVVSVEMFEHVRNWSELLGRVTGWLRPGGRLFAHVFCHREFLYPFEDRGPRDWMTRHFFTGGLMPSADLFGAVESPLRVEAQWHYDGRHYARTLRAWLARHDRARTEFLRAHAATAPDGAPRAHHRWRLFYLACAELFAYAQGREWFVTHVRLAPREEGA